MPPTPSARPVLVAVNPHAGSGRGARIGNRAVAALDAAGWTVMVLREENAERLAAVVAEALGSRPHALVVVGGDGMVSLGAGLVAGTDVPLGIVPCGTGNDMARNLGLPVGNPDAALVRLVGAFERPPRRIDAARVTGADGRDAWFACALSAGFDAAVTERANGMRRPRGASRYVLALLREIVAFGAVDYTLTVDGREERVPAVLVSVANAGSIGGGMRIAPDAALDDGELDLLVVSPLSRLTFLRLFPRVFRGTHASLPQVRLARARTVRIDAAGARKPIVAYADGERLGPLPVDIRVVPGALTVLA